MGDVVAIIAAEDEKAACKAMKLVKVKYNVLEPVLDFHKAKDNPVLVHPEDDWYPPVDVGGDAKRNVIAHELSGDGDVDAVISDCEVSFSHAYHMRAFNQAMMETFRTYTCLDRYGRLHVISSTQIVFHVRRILSRALGIPKAKSAWKTADRWWIWREADCSQRSVSGVCDDADGASGETHLHKVRKPDRRFAAA